MAKTFLDASILVAAFDSRDPVKRDIARRLIDELAASQMGCVSTQVLQELFVNLTRRLAVPPMLAKAKLAPFDRFECAMVLRSTVDDAIDLMILHSLTIWDATVVQCAKDLNCERILSEDLPHGTRYGGVLVENPFPPV